MKSLLFLALFSQLLTTNSLLAGYSEKEKEMLKRIVQEGPAVTKKFYEGYVNYYSKKFNKKAENYPKEIYANIINELNSLPEEEVHKLLAGSEKEIQKKIYDKLMVTASYHLQVYDLGAKEYNFRQQQRERQNGLRTQTPAYFQIDYPDNYTISVKNKSPTETKAEPVVASNRVRAESNDFTAQTKSVPVIGETEDKGRRNYFFISLLIFVGIVAISAFFKSRKK